MPGAGFADTRGPDGRRHHSPAARRLAEELARGHDRRRPGRVDRPPPGQGGRRRRRRRQPRSTSSTGSPTAPRWRSSPTGRRRRARRAPPLDRARAGPGRAPAVARRPLRHRPGRSRTASTTTSSCPAGRTSATTTSSASRPRCARSSPRTSPSSATSTPSTRACALRRPALQARDHRGGAPTVPTSRRAGRGRTGSPGRRTYRNAPTPSSTCAAARTCPSTGRLGHFKLHARGRRVLARRRAATRSSSASTARPGSRRRRWPSTSHRLEEAERRDHRKLGAELDLFSLPRRDRLGPGRLPPQGRHSSAG